MSLSNDFIMLEINRIVKAKGLKFLGLEDFKVLTPYMQINGRPDNVRRLVTLELELEKTFKVDISQYDASYFHDLVAAVQAEVTQQETKERDMNVDEMFKELMTRFRQGDLESLYNLVTVRFRPGRSSGPELQTLVISESLSEFLLRNRRNQETTEFCLLLVQPVTSEEFLSNLAFNPGEGDYVKVHQNDLNSRDDEDDEDEEESEEPDDDYPIDGMSKGP